MKSRKLRMEEGAWQARSVLECGSPLPLSVRQPADSRPCQSARGLAQSKTWRRFVVVFLLTTLSFAVNAHNYSIDWFKITGGGGASSNGQYTVTGSVGQPEAGATMGGGNYSLTGGFWSVIAVVQNNAAPALTLGRSGNSITVSWPSPATGWTLQQCSNLAAGGWTTSGYPVSDDGTTKRITISSPTGSLFFRLAK